MSFGSIFKWSGCALCPSEGGNVADTIVVRAGRVKTDSKGRKTIIRERLIPVCAAHAASVQLAPDRATVEAQRKVAAREWKSRQTSLLDGRAYQVGSSERRGWWEV